MHLLVAANSDFFTLANGVWAIVCIAGAIVTGFVFRGAKAKNLVDLQDDTIKTLKDSNEAKDDRITELERHVELLSGQMDSMGKEISVLRELVTNSAKVELLRQEMHQEFGALRATLDQHASVPPVA